MPVLGYELLKTSQTQQPRRCAFCSQTFIHSFQFTAHPTMKPPAFPHANQRRPQRYGYWHLQRDWPPVRALLEQ